MYRLRQLGFLFAACMICCSAASAGNKDKDRRAELQRLEADRQAAEDQAEALEEAREEAEETRASVKADLVRITRTLQQHEKKLQKVERREAEINRTIQGREASLKERQKELEAMMAAAIRLSQTPPEAGLMMPEYSEQTIEAASALKLMTQTIHVRAAELRQELQALEEDRSEATRIRGEIDDAMQDIRKKRQALDAALKEKSRRVTAVDAEQKAQMKRAKSIARQAADLKQLIFALEEKVSETPKSGSTRKNAEVQAASNTGGKRGKLRSFSRAKGDIRPPGGGQVVSEYDAGDDDEHSKGVVIETASNATISAPYDAEVVFVGPFRRYGNMIILKHTDGFHTLIAGLQKIRISVGEFLLEGEPIGAMGGSVDSRKLYVELRKNNQPINPASWFEGL